MKAKIEKLQNKIVPKEVDKDGEKELDPELLLGDEIVPNDIEEEKEEEDEENSLLDDDEVDPFKDKWEE